MPWKESSVMDERMRFVIRLKDGESMASLCREYGISRPTGYKIFESYEECGIEGLTDRSRRPYLSADAGRLVINKTGLIGAYDIHIKGLQTAEHSLNAANADADTGNSIFS